MGGWDREGSLRDGAMWEVRAQTLQTGLSPNPSSSFIFCVVLGESLKLTKSQGKRR